jgi:two-component system, chemotaxis family, sensor kinase CheA
LSIAKDPYRYFRVEARELLDGLTQGVLELERGTVSKDLIGKLLRLAHTLKGAARVVKLVELARHAHDLEDLLAPHREGEGPVVQASVNELLHLLDAMTAQLTAIDPSKPAVSPAAPAQVTQEPLETVRVEIEEMDLLLEGVTEATVQINSLRRESETIDRAQHLAAVLVEQLSPRRSRDFSGANDVTLRAYGLAEELRGAVERLGRNISNGVEQVSRELSQVREAADRLRLLPASAIFSPLERAARDAAEVLGKRMVFGASGGEGRLDAHVLSALRDALFHVVRNAVAHGIESEAERAVAGKPGAGHVQLVVERRGNKIAFVCSDDGRGIDVEALRREAVRRGVLSASESSSLRAEELFRLLLKGGLTTTRTVTEVSGRGVGLDVVRETANRLHGEVSIKSEAGLGTSIEICVPVSLSSLSALVVDAGGVSAVVPLDAVRRTLRLVESEIARGSESDSIVYEGKVIPFVPLAKALRRPAASARERRQWSAVVVQSGTALAAVGVDRLLGTRTAVVRPLPSHVDAEPVVAGASLDAEGNPQLVLDPNGLVAAAEAGRGAALKEPAMKLPVLVVDDSLTTRMLEQSILESAGYEVDLATSAEEALVRAKERRYGLFVVDVEMPGMDGFEFVAKTRTDPLLQSTPAILVTSRGSTEDRRRGQEAGARGYIVKGEFDQNYLLQVIRELLG